MQSPFHGASDVAREQAWLFGLVDVCRPNLVLDELVMPLAEGPQGCSSILPTWVALSA